MTDFLLEQAIYDRQGTQAPALRARSPGFRDDWLVEAAWLVTGFGERPHGVSCPGAVFAQPLGRDHVAVVQVADVDGATTRFHILELPRSIYEKDFGDPFVIADRFPPPWSATGSLPTCSWTGSPPARRTVAEIQGILKRVKSFALKEDEDPQAEPIERTVENSESPALLGGAQVLVDGGRLVFKRSAPDPALIRGLWTLLPTTTRCKLWPASFAFGNALGFDALVVPRIAGEDFQDYMTEDQAAEYPAGRYEFNLQVAAEEGDQRELDALLGRRSVADTRRLALVLLILVTFVAIVSQLVQFPGNIPPPPARPEPPKLSAAAGIIAVADPWTALSMIRAGNQLWQGANPD